MAWNCRKGLKEEVAQVWNGRICKRGEERKGEQKELFWTM